MGRNIEPVKEELGSRRVRYSREFKLEAVRQLESGHKSGIDLAMELGVRRDQLYMWREQLSEKGADKAFPGAGRKPSDERSEIEQLRAELKQVREERDILKKAAAYFAKELP
jgi:transposase